MKKVKNLHVTYSDFLYNDEHSYKGTKAKIKTARLCHDFKKVSPKFAYMFVYEGMATNSRCEKRYVFQ